LLNKSNQIQSPEAEKIFKRIKSTQLLAGKTVGPIIVPKTNSRSLGFKVDLEAPVEFKSGGFTIKDLTATAKESLLYLAAFFKERKITEIKIIGHTDSEGDAKRNLELSKRRANSVKEYLKGCVNVGATIKTEGKGEMEPLLIPDWIKQDFTPNEINQLNRRVEFKYW